MKLSVLSCSVGRASTRASSAAAALLLSVAACGDDAPETARDASVGPQPDAAELDTSYDAGELGHDAAASGPYVVCDGSERVRLAVRSAGGGPLEPTFGFTHPYGHSFLFVTGKCEYMAGGDLTHGVVTGSLSREQAERIQADLALERLPSFSKHQDEACPDASVLFVQTATGYGECSCGCDDDAPTGLAQVIDAAGKLQQSLAKGTVAPDSVLDVIAFSTDDTSQVYQAWPLGFDLASIALPEADAYESENKNKVQQFEGADATSLRALRTSARAAVPDGSDVRVKTAGGQRYRIYVRDQVPSPFAEVIETSQLQPPR
jgi:hypothetical protein